VAKVIAWGETRDDARERLIEAIAGAEIEGISSNREFLIACLKDELFATGSVWTGFIDQRLEHLLAPAAAA
jgi:3-methylcrotonyl-CoA carboxylase alpha subunit